MHKFTVTMTNGNITEEFSERCRSEFGGFVNLTNRIAKRVGGRWATVREASSDSLSCSGEVLGTDWTFAIREI